MNRRWNKKRNQRLNVRGQTAGCKASYFLGKYNIVLVLQSTVVTLEEWKILQKELCVDDKIGALLVNSKVAHKYVLFQELNQNQTPITISLGQYQGTNVALNQNFTIEVEPENDFLSQPNRNIEERKRIGLFQSSTLLIGCQSQKQVSQIFQSIINKKFFLLPSSSSMVFPWLHCKLRYLPHNRILLGGIYKTIKYSHLDFYQQNNKNSMTYPNFRDSLLKKMALLLSLYFTFLQRRVASIMPTNTPFLPKSI